MDSMGPFFFDIGKIPTGRFGDRASDRSDSRSADKRTNVRGGLKMFNLANLLACNTFVTSLLHERNLKNVECST